MTQLVKGSLGKVVLGDVYLHVSALGSLRDEKVRSVLAERIESVSKEFRRVPNVVKIRLSGEQYSLLLYEDFDRAAFPQLMASWTISNDERATVKYRTYEASLNRPILHRKELLVDVAYPQRDQWVETTRVAEQVGLFDNPSEIGFRLGWERVLSARGFRVVDDALLPIGNDEETLESFGSGGSASAEARELDAQTPSILRHLTALSRSSISSPVQLLVRNGLLTQDKTFFDYGCGRGDDLKVLQGSGVQAAGWDPHYAERAPLVEADVVNLGFVINVIESVEERQIALKRAFSLAKKVLAVSVMLNSKSSPGRPFRDGVITSKSTFQKYFSQAEFKAFLEQTLARQVYLVGPGVAFVFADADAEQNYAAGKFRSHSLADRLLVASAQRLKPVPMPRKNRARSPRESRSERILGNFRAEFDQFWKCALELGRYPEQDEVNLTPELLDEVGSVRRAQRILEAHYDQEVMSQASDARANDLLLFFAAQHFSRKPPFSRLSPRMQRDIRRFFGSYEAASAAGRKVLSEAADTDSLRRACEAAAARGMGWLDERGRSLQVHVDLAERLPVVLRVYVSCGLILWDSTSDLQLIKIHIESGKLSLMEYEGFDEKAIPMLVRRVKVNLRELDFQIFEYGTEQYPFSPLLWKSRYINEDYPGFAEQELFDQELADLEIFDREGYGLTPETLSHALSQKRLAVSGTKLVPSDQVPSLDQRCGHYLTYRSFIQCGETQCESDIENLPRSAASYNDLYALATEILDPVIDYFGGIKLTYGFCSAELGKKIKGRVAPKLDQHAASELNRSGKPICSRGGAACDFLVEDEDMEEVAEWIIRNLPFDRLYFYGTSRPIHVSFGPDHSREAYRMMPAAQGKLIPRKWGGPAPKPDRTG